MFKNQGKENKAWKLLLEYLEADKSFSSKNVKRFVHKFCRGLNQIDTISDRDIRQATRILWYKDALRKVNEVHNKNLDRYYLDYLKCAIDTFFKEKHRID